MDRLRCTLLIASFAFAGENGNSSALFDPVHVEVVISRLDAVGGRIEGTFKGTLKGPLDARLTINGHFPLVRARDRVVN